MLNQFERFNELQMKASAEYFSEDMLFSAMISKRDELHKWVIEYVLSKKDIAGLFVEFGVYKGISINLFAKHLAKHNLSITGFDAFEGIEENWDTDRLRGRYSLQGVVPQVEPNVYLKVGWVQDTLPLYMQENNGLQFRFIHLDMDTYTPTRFVLDLLVPNLQKGTVILFDELHGYPHWRAHEFKALQETLPRSRYKFIAFGLQQAAIEIIS
jgi:hypothetical protein